MRVLPERVEISTRVPFGAVARPPHHAPRGDGLRVADIRRVGAAIGTLGAEPEDLARVRGGEQRSSVAIGGERRDLLGVGAADERRLIGVAGQTVDLALVAGGDEHVRSPSKAMSYGVSSRDSQTVSDAPSAVIRKIAPAPGPTGTRALPDGLVAGDESTMATAVISVETLTGAVRRGIVGEVSARRCVRMTWLTPPAARPRTAAAKIEPSAADAQLMDLAVSGVEQHERLARGIDLEHATG